MSLRAPSRFGQPAGWSNPTLDILHREMAEEKALALGAAGRKVAASLAELRACEGGEAERGHLLRRAAETVHAYFIQRELCGLRRHEDVIREYGIPKQVLARLGAR